MQKLTAKHWIFDLDGTLVDSSSGVADALVRAFDSCQMRPAVPIDTSLIGPPLRRMLAIAAGTGDHATLTRLASAFRDCYDEHSYMMTTAYAGIDEALCRLREQGVVLHLATNKRSVPTDRIVTLFGWDDLFRSIYCSDSLSADPASKADLVSELIAANRVDRTKALLIGDSIDDADAARECSIRFLAATWGYGSGRLLSRYPSVDRVTSPVSLWRDWTRSP